jgi:hypothetical protein
MSELARPELKTFLENSLGNLPLSVAQCGHVARSDPAIRNVADLIVLFRSSAGLSDIDTRGRNPMQDIHYYGLDQLVRFAISRLQQATGADSEDSIAAVSLLSALAVLDRVHVPLSLLHKNGMALLRHAYSMLAANADIATQEWFRVFLDGEVLDRARHVCIQYGLLQLPAPESDCVGVLHQLVQKGLRHILVTGTRQGIEVRVSIGVCKQRCEQSPLLCLLIALLCANATPAARPKKQNLRGLLRVELFIVLMHLHVSTLLN